MWFDFIKELKKELEKETDANVFIGIDQPKDVRSYPFVSIIPTDFSEEEDKKLMGLALAFGVKEEEKSESDPAPMYERGVNNLLNLMGQIEKVLENFKYGQFEVLTEKEATKNYSVRAPKFLMEMHIVVSAPKFSPAMEDF